MISIYRKRVNFLKKVFKYYGLPFPNIFSGNLKVDNSHFNSPYYCTLSHYNVIKNADEKEFPYVIIFEDDVIPKRNIMKKIELFCNEFNKNFEHETCDLLKLETCEFNEVGKFQEKYGQKFETYYKFNKSVVANYIPTYGTGAYVVFKKAYGEMLKKLEGSLFGGRFFPVDSFHEYDLNMTITSPLLFAQYPEIESGKRPFGIDTFNFRRTDDPSDHDLGVIEKLKASVI